MAGRDAGPFGSVQIAVERACREAGKHLQGFGQNFDQCVSSMQQQAQGVLSAAKNFSDQQMRRHRFHDRRTTAPLASLNSALARRPQPLWEIAYNPEDIKARLSGVPVYTVANKNNEFVLVTGEGEKAGHQLGLFFFAKSDADALIERLKQQDPKLGKQSRVLTVSMDKVYDFAITPRKETGAQGVVFRFMPEMKQVQNAIQLYKEAGLEAGGFAGVPVFQAEGLTVKTDAAKYTPLFLSKSDLDVAVGNAYTVRKTERAEAVQAKFDAAVKDEDTARKELKEAKGKNERKAAQGAVDKASEQVEKYKKRLEETSKIGLPKIEVGCLEEVITKMESDTKGDWSEVMFIPAGTLASPDPAGK